MLRVSVLLALCALVACHKKEAPRNESAKSPEATSVIPGAKPALRVMAPAFDQGWADRCLGEPKRVPWEPTHIIAASAAARAALDGATEVPQVNVPSHAPERQAEVAWAVASAALAAKRDAAALIDGAFAATDPVSDASKRDRLLAWGAIALRGSDAARATKWAAAIRDKEYKPELAAYEVVRLAQAGDGAAAKAALAALPPNWSLYSDVEFWFGYPRWLGSAASAACVALAVPKFASSPAARSLVEEAERLTVKVDEDWRQNRENRALALAWARVGDLERAMVAASRMPGTERSGAVVAVLDEFGDAPGVDLAQLDKLARRAMAATRKAPLVLGKPSTDRAELNDFIDQGILGEVVAALVRRHIKRGDLKAAQAAVDSIPDNYSKHYEAALQLGCARKAKGEVTVEAIVAELPSGAYEANLAEAAAQVGCMDVMQRVLRTARYPERIADNIASAMLGQGRLDNVLAMLRTIEELAPDRNASLHGDLIFALAQAGRVADALALLEAIPAQEYKTVEQSVIGAGYRAVVVRMAAGDTAGAKALDAALAPRFARVGTRSD